jgi:hypothetical protein
MAEDAPVIDDWEENYDDMSEVARKGFKHEDIFLWKKRSEQLGLKHAPAVPAYDVKYAQNNQLNACYGFFQESLSCIDIANRLGRDPRRCLPAIASFHQICGNDFKDEYETLISTDQWYHRGRQRIPENLITPEE